MRGCISIDSLADFVFVLCQRISLMNYSTTCCFRKPNFQSSFVCMSVLNVLYSSCVGPISLISLPQKIIFNTRIELLGSELFNRKTDDSKPEFSMRQRRGNGKSCNWILLLLIISIRCWFQNNWQDEQKHIEYNDDPLSGWIGFW